MQFLNCPHYKSEDCISVTTEAAKEAGVGMIIPAKSFENKFRGGAPQTPAGLEGLLLLQFIISNPQSCVCATLMPFRYWPYRPYPASTSAKDFSIKLQCNDAAQKLGQAFKVIRQKAASLPIEYSPRRYDVGEHCGIQAS